MNVTCNADYHDYTAGLNFEIMSVLSGQGEITPSKDSRKVKLGTVRVKTQ